MFRTFSLQRKHCPVIFIGPFLVYGCFYWLDLASYYSRTSVKPTTISSEKFKDAPIKNMENQYSTDHSMSLPLTGGVKARIHNYHFIEPPYEGEDPMDIRVLHNVCLEQLSSKSKLSRTVVYTSKEQASGFVTHGYMNTFNITWDVAFTDKDLPSNISMMSAPAFFFIQKFPSNLFHFFEDGIRGLYALLDVTGRLGMSGGNYVFTYDCNDAKSEPRIAFYELFYKMSPDLRYMGCPRMPKFTNVCFQHGVFGFIRRLERDRQNFTDHLKRVTGIEDIICPKPQIIFLDRTYRRAANTEEMVQAIQRLGLNNTVIEIVEFEKISVIEQLKKIHCTNILIGVHGAGMEWLQFLPKDGGVLELGWNHWYPDQWRFMAIRRGLVADVQYAQNVTIEWSKFAAFNKINGNITIEDKERYLKDNDPMWERNNPYRYGLGYFNITIFTKKLLRLITQISDKFKIKF